MSGVWGVMLAAGSSRRFLEAARHDSDESYPRTLKQLQPFEGEPLVRRMARRALGSRLERLVVIGGYRASDVRQAVATLDVTFVDNRNHAEGRSTSVRAALDELTGDVSGAMFIPVDQPLLDTPTLDSLVSAFESAGESIVVPTGGGRRGAPVVFPQSLFSELRELRGDAGGRDLFDRFAERVLEIEIADERALFDIDTPDELRRLRDLAD